MEKTTILENHVEAILFFKGEPVSIKKLSELIGVTSEEIVGAKDRLKAQLQNRGLSLIEHNDSILLATGKSSANIIQNLIKDELYRDLSKAGLETLSIIMYLGPISRSEIDNIRGVNSTFILRNLLIRGLVERTEKTENKRVLLYQATFELLGYLGLSAISDLPQYEDLRNELIKKQNMRNEAENNDKSNS